MFSSTVLVAATGLLTIVSAAPASSYYGPCIDGVRLGVLRFDDLTPDTTIPNGYAGFDWTNITVTRGPLDAVHHDVPFLGATPRNAIVMNDPKHPKDVALMSLVSAAHNNLTSSIRSFSALCVVPDTTKGAKGSRAVDCSFELLSDTRQFGIEDKFNYTVPKIVPGFTTFGSEGYLSFYQYYFVVTSKVDGVKPRLIIDNMVIERQC